MVLSPEHKLVNQITTAEQRAPVAAYKTEVAKKSDLERTELAKDKTGVFTGAYAINPVNGEKIPIWIADYVLATYGTGAIMAVPAHDERDLAFAKKFDLPIRLVVQAPQGQESHRFCRRRHVSVNSDFLTGLPTPEAKKAIAAWLESKGLGTQDHQLQAARLALQPATLLGRTFPDHLETRCQSGNLYHEALPESALPLLPPQLTDFKPTSDGRAAAGPRQGMGQSARRLGARDQHHAAMGRQLLVLPALPGLRNNQNSFCGRAAEKYWMGTAAAQPSEPNPRPGR